ncbi:hypothetical protein DV738_g2888, partial [Chaetothyriales sp. CBS 135597]
MTESLDSRLAARRTPSPKPSRITEEVYSERFPSFDTTAPPSFGLPVVTESTLETDAVAALESKWPLPRGNPRSREGRQNWHRPRKSVSEALNNFRIRRGSVSENAQELAEALKAPVSYTLIGLCIAWYMTSALTNTSSKSILNAFPKPATLTIAQFASVSVWCLILNTTASLFPSLKKTVPALRNGLRRPSWDVIATALPLSVFQLLGHLLSSYATSKIPVSLVHTIKGLSPLFTVLAYRVFFRIRYMRATYMSLVPLTLGVMMACSTDFSTNFWGLSAALIATLVFVVQNIFSKKLFTESARAEAEGQTQRSRKLDKLNLLCYCSVGAFMLSAPVWLYTEGFAIMEDFWKDGAVNLSAKKGAMDHGELVFEFIFNGLTHFFQNILAFVLLSMMSPVSYSVASLIKRVWVIAVAVIWFRSSTTGLQLAGIVLTLIGLYLYDRTSMEDAAERRAKSGNLPHDTPLLPLAAKDQAEPNGHVLEPQSGGLGPISQQSGRKTTSKTTTSGRCRQSFLHSPIMSTTVVHTDSLEDDRPDDKSKAKKQKSGPILTPKTVLPIFFAIGIIFAPIGGLLLWASYSVQELVIDYTDCNSTSSEFTTIPDSKVSASFKTSNFTKPSWRLRTADRRPPYSAVNITNTPICTLQFDIPNNIGPPVYLYYRLTSFYQNHRRYVKSLDTDQLKGNFISNSSISSSACNPLRTNGSDFAYYPCGLIANSIFNDTFFSPQYVNQGGQADSSQYTMTNKSIAWSSDADLYGKTSYKWNQVAPPPNWAERFPNGYTEETFPDLSEYEELHVWMRTAGLPKFSKLALRNDDDVMKAGTYTMDIYDYFPVQLYGGTKSILISTRTVMGGKNSFLGIAYVVIGGLCIVLGVIFTAAHLIRPRKLGDHTYLSWNNDAAPTATTTGRETHPGTSA